jgi:hypothetical protein
MAAAGRLAPGWPAAADLASDQEASSSLAADGRTPRVGPGTVHLVSRFDLPLRCAGSQPPRGYARKTLAKMSHASSDLAVRLKAM